MQVAVRWLSVRFLDSPTLLAFATAVPYEFEVYWYMDGIGVVDVSNGTFLSTMICLGNLLVEKHCVLDVELGG